MKKKVIFGDFTILGVVAVAAWNVNIGLKSDGILSDIALANIEALANNEGGSSSITCYSTYRTTSNQHI